MSKGNNKMQQKSHVIAYIIACVMVIICVSCNNTDKMNTKELWKNRYIVETKELLRIGTDDLNDDVYTFSGINDIQIDGDNYIYVLDRQEMNIKVFSSDGKHKRTIKFAKGQGPKEIGHPVFFSLDNNNHIYITDDINHRISIYDNEGKYLDYMNLDFLPGLIGVREDSIFVTNSLDEAGKNAIYEFGYPSKKLIRSFCRLDSRNKAYKRVGGNGAFCFDNNGEMLYSSVLPYQIGRYSKSGELIAQYSRDLRKSIGYKINEYGLPYADMITMDIYCFSDGRFINVILDRGIKPTDSIVDIFSNSGEWLIALSANKYFDNWFGRIVRIDKNDCIYLEYWKPYPHIRKYAIKIDEIAKMNRVDNIE